MKVLMRCLFLLSLSLPAAAADDSEISIEQFLQNLSTVPDVATRKDPFIAVAPPFGSGKVDGGYNLNAPVLERYPASSYGVVAVLLGEQYPRALIKLPEAEKGKVVIVREKDKFGNRGGIISKINKEGLVVVQNQRSPLGFIDKTELVIRVGDNTAVPAGAAPAKPAPPAN